MLLPAVLQEELISIRICAPLDLLNLSLLVEWSTVPPKLHSIEMYLREHTPCANHSGTPLPPYFKASDLHCYSFNQFQTS